MVNPYADERPVEKVLIVAITSDKGLCGPFNSNVFKEVNNLVEERYRQVKDSGNLTIMPIGKRALEFYHKRSQNRIEDFGMLFNNLNFKDARKAAEQAMEGFVEGTYDQVILVYNEFKNVATQVLRAEQLLPMVPQLDEDEEPEVTDYIYEPSMAEIVEELIPKSIKLQFFTALLESNASEHGARMTAMDKATDNAGSC